MALLDQACDTLVDVVRAALTAYAVLSACSVYTGANPAASSS